MVRIRHVRVIMHEVHVLVAVRVGLAGRISRSVRVTMMRIVLM